MPKQRVAYYYQNDIGHYYYGPGHPMKPHRLKLAHHLVCAYGLYRKMEVYRPHLATPEELTRFHSDDYIDFLRRVTPENARVFASGGTGNTLAKYNLGEFTDCPVFGGLFQYCQAYAGASIDAAVRLNHGHADVAVNWSGGLHHAKKCEASGFCYVNDIVLAILEMLKYHQRVLYIDIDVHHGDGVEEAFLTTDRVMTVSFHKFGDFFPGTGAIKDVGMKSGKYYSVNFPLHDGIDDESYLMMFKPVIAKIMEVYRPGAVVLQCGADSLTGDRLGCFNLTIKGHAECVRFVKSFGLPTLVLGGGGYTIRNVARCWVTETATVLDEVLPDYIPPNDYIEFYKPDYRLHLDPAVMENMNSREYLEKCKAVILENLRYLEAAPSVAFQEVPPDWAVREAEEELRYNGGSQHPDARARGVIQGHREHDADFYAGDADIDADRHAEVPSEGSAGAAETAGQDVTMGEEEELPVAQPAADGPSVSPVTDALAHTMAAAEIATPSVTHIADAAPQLEEAVGATGAGAAAAPSEPTANDFATPAIAPEATPLPSVEDGAQPDTQAIAPSVPGEAPPAETAAEASSVDVQALAPATAVDAAQPGPAEPAAPPAATSSEVEMAETDADVTVDV